MVLAFVCLSSVLSVIKFLIIGLLFPSGGRKMFERMLVHVPEGMRASTPAFDQPFQTFSDAYMKVGEGGWVGCEKQLCASFAILFGV